MNPPLDPRKLQSPAVRIVNAVATRWRKAISLDPEHLMEKARRTCHLTDFGGDDIREALRVLSHSMDRELPLHFTGRLLARRDILRSLTTRLKVVEHLRAYPETEAVPLPDPVVITGLPRSGTTFLQRLLAQDPRTRTLRAWELHNPVPPPPGTPDTRFERSVRGRALFLRQFYSAAGRETRRAIHFAEATDPEECGALLRNCLRTSAFPARAAGPEYASWLEAQDLTETYRFYRKQLQIMTAAQPAERLLVKHPGHLHRLDEIFSVFPGARIVWVHRDPIEAIPSVCSLTVLTLAERTNAARTGHLGPIVVDVWVRSVARGMEARARHSEDRFLDVYYRDLIGDPAGTARRIYEFLGWPWEQGSEELLTNWLAQDREARRGISHRYSAEAFGLTADEIQRAFRSYTETFPRVAERSPAAAFAAASR